MQLEQVMVIAVEVEEVLSAGNAGLGEVRVIPFGPGRFEGEDGLSGRLLPGGTDWQRVRDDGTLEIRAHYMLETDASERIEVISEGLRAAAPAVLARLAAGEAVAPEEYYFRTAIRLASGAPRLSHLNDRIYIGSGKRAARAVEITVYRVP